MKRKQINKDDVFCNGKVINEVEKTSYGRRRFLCNNIYTNKKRVIQINHLVNCSISGVPLTGKDNPNYKNGYSILNKQKKMSEYNIGVGIKQRCYNNKNQAYKNYGGRGIKVCDRGKNSFENFYKDMGERPSMKHSIDRIDNNKGYCKDNCRWATREEQNRNTRRTLYFDFNGEMMSLYNISKIVGIKYTTLRQRIVKYKIPLEKAVLKEKGKKITY